MNKEKKTTNSSPEKKDRWFSLLCLACIVLLLVNTFVVRLAVVDGSSMYPTLKDGELMVVWRFCYAPTAGDIVVIDTSESLLNQSHIVKRVIATEGQTVDIDFASGEVYVDGVLLVEDYINAPTLHNWEGDLGLEYPAVVPEGCVFVLGDNRNNSMDSRYAPIGMVPEQYVLGKVLFIALPGQTADNNGNPTEPRDWGRLGLVS